MLIQIDNPPHEAAGWERRFTADPERAKEATDLYQRLGFEVRTEPVHPAEFGDECGGCHSVALQFQTVYTRKRPSGALPIGHLTAARAKR